MIKKVNEAMVFKTTSGKKFEIDPAQLAIRFCDVQPFVTSTIIGATTMDQLKTCINSVHLDLNKEILNEIKNIHKEIPHPAP